MQQTGLSPTIGIGACLIGKPVRYNGSHKRGSTVLENMGKAMTLRPFCPEVAIGLGVPREPIRIVETEQGRRARDSESQTLDYTADLEAFADEVAADNALSGYIFVKGSPSCGYQRVKVYNEKGNSLPSDGVGIFARRLMRRRPLLPVEEEGRLNDIALRERFIRRVYAFHDWQLSCGDAPSFHQLISFYSRYKYLVMAHHYPSYKRIGRLLSKPDERLERQSNKLIALIMHALSFRAERGAYANALSHVKGYLKRHIKSDEKQLLDGVIEDYRCGKVPLVVPVRMLVHYFKLYPNEYIGEQAFFYAYPDELGVRNHMS